MPSTNVLRCITVVAISLAPVAGVHCSAAGPEQPGVSEGQSVTTQAGPVHPAASSSLCLDVVNQSTANGAGVQVWSCSGNANQQWTYDGARLTIYGGTKCLDVTGGSTTNGTKLQIWDCVSGDANQEWTLSGKTLQWTGHATCMDLTGGAAQNGTLIQSWACSANNENQEWVFNQTSNGGSSSSGSSSGGSSSSCNPNAWVYVGTNANACTGNLGEPCGWTTTNEGQGYTCQTESWGAGCEPGGTVCPGGGGSSSGGSGSSSGSSSGGTTPPPSGRQSLVWVWMDYPQSLAAVAANPGAFTHVSPSLYELNYSYSSGVAAMQSDDGPDNFDGLSSAQIASQIHAAGKKCVPLIQAGAGNGGTDQGIQNVVSNSGTQSSFISAMVQEAVTKGYDGYSLDWEVGGGTTYSGYGPGMTSFLGAFQSALHAHGMVLQLVVGDWYIRQSNCSGGDGYVDLQAASSNVDQVIIMDYETGLGSPTTSCNASVSNPANCGNDFGSDLNLMCAYVPLDKINIGLDSDPNAGNNDIAGACISATLAADIPAVSIWPEYNTSGPGGSYLFCDTTNISPSGTTWFTLLSDFVSGK